MKIMRVKISDKAYRCLKVLSPTDGAEWNAKRYWDGSWAVDLEVESLKLLHSHMLSNETYSEALERLLDFASSIPANVAPNAFTDAESSEIRKILNDKETLH